MTWFNSTLAGMSIVAFTVLCNDIKSHGIQQVLSSSERRATQASAENLSIPITIQSNGFSKDCPCYRR